MKNEKPSIAEIIKSLPIDSDYIPVDNLPIPLHKGVLVKKIQQSSIQLLSSGIMLVEGDAENSTPPHLGIIYAVGPNCSEYLKVGLRCYYNFYVNSSFRIDGVDYAKLDEADVYYLLNSKALVVEQVKDDKQVGRAKRMPVSDNAIKTQAKIDANDKDKRHDRTKGKIRKMK